MKDEIKSLHDKWKAAEAEERKALLLYQAASRDYAEAKKKSDESYLDILSAAGKLYDKQKE